MEPNLISSILTLFFVCFLLTGIPVANMWSSCHEEGGKGVSGMDSARRQTIIYERTWRNNAVHNRRLWWKCWPQFIRESKRKRRGKILLVNICASFWCASRQKWPPQQMACGFCDRYMCWEKSMVIKQCMNGRLIWSIICGFLMGFVQFKISYSFMNFFQDVDYTEWQPSAV